MFSVALFGAALYMIPLIGVELQPAVDEGEIRINVELEPGTRVEVTEILMNQLYGLTRENFPEVQTVMLTAGGGSSGRSGSGGHLGEMRIQLKDRAERERTAAEVAAALRPMLQIEPGMMVKTRISSGMFSRRGGGEDSDRLSIQIRGHDMDAGMEYAKQIRDAMGRIRGVAEPQISQRPGMPEMLVQVDRPRAASMGLNVSEIADALETAIGGRRTSMFREGGDEYNILVRLREEDRLSLPQVGAVPLATPVGRTIPAESVVKLKRQEGPTYISRIDQQRIITVNGSLDDRDLGSVVADMEASLRQIPRPEGFDIVFRRGV